MWSVRECLLVCITVILVVLGGVSYRLATGSRAPQTAAWTLGGDYAAFHMGGRILNLGLGHRLYDLTLQESVYRELVPEATGLTLPFPYPPFIAALFRPLAWLPLPTALAIFLVLSPLAYVAALVQLARRLGPSAPEERALVVAAALSFLPFVGYTWLGAQITVIAFVAVALAVIEDERGRGVTSGLALSLCGYKPTLLLLVVPMLLVTGRVRHLVGLALGAALLVVASIAAAGSGSLIAMVERVQSLNANYRSPGAAFADPYRFVDINNFFRLLPFGRSTLGTVVCVSLVIVAAVALAHLWVVTRRGDRQVKRLVWAATLTWTAVLNAYTSSYDTILVVVAAVLTVAALRARGWQGWGRMSWALTLVYLAPWVAELSTRLTGVQVYTIALAWFGTLLVIEARRAADRGQSIAQST